MNDFPNFIHEEHNTFLKNLSGISELSDIAKPENSNNLVSWKERINIVTMLHILGDYFRTSLTEANGKETTNFS